MLCGRAFQKAKVQAGTGVHLNAITMHKRKASNVRHIPHTYTHTYIEKNKPHTHTHTKKTRQTRMLRCMVCMLRWMEKQMHGDGPIL